MISTHADWETVVFQVQFYCVLKTMSFKSLKRFNINVVKYLEQKFDFLDNVYLHALEYHKCFSYLNTIPVNSFKVKATS